MCNEQGEVKRVGRSWLRSDGVWVLNVSDESRVVECNTNYLEGACYDSRCAACFLGHAHSKLLHDSNLRVRACLDARWGKRV